MNEYRLLLVVYTFLLISASNAGESINTAIPRDNVYGVLSQEVYRISSISNNRKSAKLNCVFFPLDRNTSIVDLKQKRLWILYRISKD